MTQRNGSAMDRPLYVIDSPSNLGLRPPQTGAVPGCYKLGWALREAGLLDDRDAHSLGTVVPPRYEAAWEPGIGDRNADGIAATSIRLADRLNTVPPGAFILVLGGDCSNLIGVMLGLKRTGRYGLAFLDGHDDFRHPGNSETIGAAAGEDLAIVTGRGDHRLIDIGGNGPYVAPTDVAAAGMRPGDPDSDVAELTALGAQIWTTDLIRQGPLAVAASMLDQLTRPGVDGFWVHLDLDILDESVMPAVDSPSSDGVLPHQLQALLTPLVSSSSCVGLDASVFDPDLDPDGRHATTVVEILKPVLDAATHPDRC